MMWTCPSLCDESLIQEPIKHYRMVDSSIPGKKIGLCTSHCPLCGKHMSQIFYNKRTLPFIVTKLSQQSSNNPVDDDDEKVSI